MCLYPSYGLFDCNDWLYKLDALLRPADSSLAHNACSLKRCITFQKYCNRKLLYYRYNCLLMLKERMEVHNLSAAGFMTLSSPPSLYLCDMIWWQYAERSPQVFLYLGAKTKYRLICPQIHCTANTPRRGRLRQKLYIILSSYALGQTICTMSVCVFTCVKAWHTPWNNFYQIAFALLRYMKVICK